MTQAGLFEAPLTTKAQAGEVNIDGVTFEAVRKIAHGIYRGRDGASSLLVPVKFGGGFKGWHWHYNAMQVRGDVKSGGKHTGYKWLEISCCHPDGRKVKVVAPEDRSAFKPESVRAFITSAAEVLEKTEAEVVEMIKAQS